MTLSPRLPLAGLVLIPDESTCDLLVRMHEYADTLPGRGGLHSVDLRRHRPHLTLWQSPVLEGASRAAASAVPGPGSTTLGRLYEQAGGWVFAACPVPYEWHLNAMNELRPYVDLRAAEDAHAPAGCTPGQEVAHYAHGYRYAAGQYEPHITLGRGTADSELRAWWNDHGAGHPVTWDRAEFVTVGPDESAVTVLRYWNLGE